MTLLVDGDQPESPGDHLRAAWDHRRVVIEHGTAAALASGAYHPAVGERLAILLCGANTDPSDLAQ